MQDMTYRLVHLMINTVVPCQKRGQLTVKVCLGSVQSFDVNGHFSNPALDYELYLRFSTAAAIFSMMGLICWCFIFMEARLTTSLVLMWSISSRASRPLAFKVLPVSTISTISSASPRIGANSIAP